MKEMENNNFIHTLDAVYNLCSEIKELVNVETEKQEDEGSEGIVLLSDFVNLIPEVSAIV